MKGKLPYKQNKTKLIDTENRLLIAKGEGEWGSGKMGEKDQEIQTSRYKINKSEYAMYRMVTVVNNVMLHV